MVLALCFAMSINAFAATKSDKENDDENYYKFSVQANEEQLAEINMIKNKKISRLEFFQEVFPEIAEHFTEHQKEFYASLPFITSSNKTDDATPQDFSWMYSGSEISQAPSDRSIFFETWGQSLGDSVEFMLIDSYLVDINESFVDFATTDDYDTAFSAAYAIHYDPDRGTYYRTEGTTIFYYGGVAYTQVRNSDWLESI